MNNNWTYKKLGEVISSAPVIRCGNQILPVLSMTMHDGIVLQKDRFKKELASVDKSAYKVVKRGQFVVGFPIDEGVLFVQNVVDKGIISPAYNIWDINTSAINSEYLEKCLHGPYAMYYYKNKLHGSTARRRTLPNKEFISIPIPVPPLSEQEAIVRELDLIHSIIDKKNEQLRELDNLAQSIFYTMFGDPIVNDKGWEVKKLGEVTIKCKNIKWSEQGKKDFTYIDLTAVNRDSKQIELPQKINATNAPSRAKQIIKENDILFATTRPTLKRVCKVSKEYNDQICSTGFCVFRHTDAILPNYIFYTLLSENFYRYIELLQTGANYPAVSDEIVRNYSLPLPPLSLQQEFAKKVEAIEAQKELIRKSITEVETLLAARMQHYFG